MKSYVKYSTIGSFNLSHLDVLIKLTNDILNAQKIIESNYKDQLGIFKDEVLYGVVEFSKNNDMLDVYINLVVEEVGLEYFKRSLLEIRHYALDNYNSLQVNISFNEVNEVIKKSLLESGFNEVSSNCYKYTHYTLVFNGSPKDGISKSICRDLENRYVNIEVIDAYCKDVNSCIDCDYCVSNPLKCVFRDMDDIYEKVYNATNIIVVSPVHVGSISSPLHAIFSRMQVFYNNKFKLNNPFPFCRKNGFAISVSGTDWNSQKEAVNTVFKHSLAEMNAEFLFHLYLTNSDKVASYSNRLKNFYEEVDKYVSRK